METKLNWIITLNLQHRHFCWIESTLNWLELNNNTKASFIAEFIWFHNWSTLQHWHSYWTELEHCTKLSWIMTLVFCSTTLKPKFNEFHNWYILQHYSYFPLVLMCNCFETVTWLSGNVPKTLAKVLTTFVQNIYSLFLSSKNVSTIFFISFKEHELKHYSSIFVY